MSLQFPRPDRIPHRFSGSDPSAGQHSLDRIPSTVQQTRGNWASVSSIHPRQQIRANTADLLMSGISSAVSLRCRGSLLTINTLNQCVFKDYMQLYAYNAVIPHITRSFPQLWIYTLLRQDYWGRPVAVTWLTGAVCCSNARKSPEEMLLNQWIQLFYNRFISSHSRHDVYGVPSDWCLSWYHCVFLKFVAEKDFMQNSYDSVSLSQYL